MFYTISLYGALALFGIGCIYKIVTWLTMTPTPASRGISPATRLTSTVTGIITAIFSKKLLTLLKVFILDGILQRKVFIENRFRWLIHILIYGGFMLLLLMHALDTLITSRLFEGYAATVNPFLFLRDLCGLLVVIGIVLALYRRYIMKAPRLTNTPMDLYALILLAVIMVSGVFLEAVKIGSWGSYQQMVTDYAGYEEGEEEFTALTAFWVTHFGTVAPALEVPVTEELIDTGRELHEMSCMGCHSSPAWALTAYPVARLIKGISLSLDRAGAPTFLWYVHFLACFIALAYLPFSKFFHIITSPLTLMANSVMDTSSPPATVATRQALEFDACMHCGNCTARCSVGVLFEIRGNRHILPSEKLSDLKAVATGTTLDETTLTSLREGTYLCTNCHRCTDVCPAGINLQELWVSLREELFAHDTPLFLSLSPLSYYRGLEKARLSPDDYRMPLERAKAAIRDRCQLITDKTAPVTLTSGTRELPGKLMYSDQASTFSACFGCQTCTNVCPVVAAFEHPTEALGMLPHQIMYAAGLGVKDLAFGSNMLWDCVTCYQCQEQCPQGVKVTEVLYELKQLAIDYTTQEG
jgi:heterodisulfide reductase subunit C/nitrate reductase gamma subunit